MTAPDARVDGERLLARLTELRSIGAAARGGVTREAFGLEDLVARDRVAGWMAEAGLEPQVDAAANLVGRRAGATPDARWLASGSHLDTVVDGGWLDGAYGVVGALEVAAALHDAGVDLAHGLAVVAFANEEGARGTDGMTGSRALVGPIDPAELDARDDEGTSLRDRLTLAGGRPGDLGAALWSVDEQAAFIELHIEQGPVLDTTGRVLGVVTAITGRQALDITLVGRANHAGTTPMELRHDALAAGAEIVLALEDLPSAGLVRVATCGHLSIHPNVRNVVPGRAVISAEVRDEDPAKLDAAMGTIEGAVREIAAKRGIEASITWGQRVSPTQVDPAVVGAIRRVVAASGLPGTELPSGAGHDAQILGEVVPMGMVFVPSLGGSSHTPVEDTRPEHLVAGAQALLDALLALDAELAP